MFSETTHGVNIVFCWSDAGFLLMSIFKYLNTIIYKPEVLEMCSKMFKS